MAKQFKYTSEFCDGIRKAFKIKVAFIDIYRKLKDNVIGQLKNLLIT